MRHAHPLSIANTTRGTLPKVPFAHIKEAVLGTRYQLSLVFIGDRRACALNRAYRSKNTVPDVLAFPLGKHEGELFINPRQAARNAPSFRMTRRRYIAFVFIHGLLHLKGMRHGATMEKRERALMRQFRVV